MKLERLESVPDEVDVELFRARKTAPTTPGCWEDPEFVEARRNEGFAAARALVEHVDAVWRQDDGHAVLSYFGVLNGLFMHVCPGYRLMVTEGPNEPRWLWVCKETE